MKQRFILPAFACLAALTACQPAPPLQTNCPSVAVLAQGSSVTEFLPGRTDVAAQIAQAKITGVAGSCTLVKKGKQLNLAFQAGFAASAGPALGGKTLVLPYLVSLSQGDTLLSKSNGTIALNFQGNALTAGATTKPIKMTFPNTPDAANTEVLVSFYLTPDQLAYNAAHPAQ